MLRTGRRGGPALAALLTVAAIAVSVQGHVLLHRCVEAPGSWAGVAVRLAVLRDVPACPAGTMGVGAVPRDAIVLLSVALPVLAAWVLTGALGISLSALVVRAVRVVIALVGRWARPPQSHALPVADRAPARAVTSRVPRPPLVLLVARPHRGPPLPA